MKASILVGLITGAVVIGGVFAFQGVLRGEQYTNEEYSFRLILPKGFTATEFPAEEGGPAAVVVEDGKGGGVQILITPFPAEVKELTPARIHANIPSLTIVDPEVLQIGPEHKGITFKSDSAAFDGSSREAWFAFKGNLYQISTYESSAPLLADLLSTWRFFN